MLQEPHAHCAPELHVAGCLLLSRSPHQPQTPQGSANASHTLCCQLIGCVLLTRAAQQSQALQPGPAACCISPGVGSDTASPRADGRTPKGKANLKLCGSQIAERFK